MKNDKLVVIVLGNRNSGKSSTWNELFGSTVRTCKRVRRLYLSQSEYVEVFLISGSPEERGIYVGKIIGPCRPNIILCSVQYVAGATQTIDYFLQHGYSVYTHWLNPGDSDAGHQPDWLGLVSYLLHHGSVFAIRDGKRDRSRRRVQEIKDFLYGWARGASLLRRRPR